MTLPWAIIIAAGILAIAWIMVTEHEQSCHSQRQESALDREDKRWDK
jgi:uncharacterized membrane protein